ncbi:uncharacterized protein EI90DRAFT_8779 [Cantharellus anzutake]|uniref:uncharacterized protein n=1 Tax=Cantharellus anzutake TaxID=1750568 RepID=UPI001904F7A8|nr:uncharacterized protein EI90DRAFT_8779 [Cantharellus anzutake]KAF8343834.1 hypothetical protein EI90DRAFT_8779 [Cantharellus anzutake]
MDKLKALGDAAYMLGNSSSRDGNCAGACSRDVVGAVGQLGGDSPSTTNEAVNILNNLDSNSIIASMHTFVKVLEAVVAVHAFVAVVVIPLKAVVRKDLQRRVNDRRTLLLVHGMIKMMRRLAELESVKLNDTQTFTLAAILREMERAIEDCRIVIEHYLRRKKIVRFAKASSWQTKFDEFSVRFSTLEGELNDALLLVIHRNTSESRQLMDGLNSKLDAILKSLGKPTELERSMACYVDAAGGIECCVEQDQRLEELIALSDGVDIDHDPKSRLQEYKQEIQSALATQIEVLLQRNSETVTAELGLRTAQVKKDIELYAQRIIKRLDSGHHERISDPCFRRIWQDATWSDPVQGKTFICTICEQIRLQVISGSSELSADKWAVQFLELSYQSSLLEAINTSRTGFVSVDEINKFTEMKPPQFTLPAWLAYSAARSGFELFHYKGAFNSVGEYLRAVTTVICDTLFASLNVPPNQRRDVEAEPWLVDQLRSFMKARDAKLVERLSALHWRTDGK